ncbi:MAG: hypothetical protein ABSE06_12960 [Anaerolineaceae bacterium]
MSQSQFQKILEGMGGAALMGVHILLPFLHGWRVRWGASDQELGRSWLGDDLVPHPRGGFTHAITIHAPISQVYPWIAQIGQDKGVFYSYEFLENLIGCNIHNADHLLPGCQEVKPGDILWMHPKAGVPIELVEAGHGFVMHGMLNTATGETIPAGAALPANFVNVSWLFYFYEIEGDCTRFVTRWRLDCPPGFKNELMNGRWGLKSIASVMDFKMLKGVRQHAEAAC